MLDRVMATLAGVAFAGFVILSIAGIWLGDSRLWQTGLVALVVSAAALASAAVSIRFDDKDKQ